MQPASFNAGWSVISQGYSFTQCPVILRAFANYVARPFDVCIILGSQVESVNKQLGSPAEITKEEGVRIPGCMTSREEP